MDMFFFCFSRLEFFAAFLKAAFDDSPEGKEGVGMFF